MRLGPGTLYGAITRLERHGLLEPLGSDDRRRPYRITPAGEALLAGTLAALRRLVDAGEARLSGGRGSLPAPRRAAAPSLGPA